MDAHNLVPYQHPPRAHGQLHAALVHSTLAAVSKGIYPSSVST